MSRFVYLLSEGVHDVAFLFRVLKHVHGAKKIEQRGALDEARQRWVGRFKWPLGDKIARLSVPAPVFVRVQSLDLTLALRNAEGIDRLRDTLEDDLDALDKDGAMPDAVGVFLDSDREPQETRFQALCEKLRTISVGAAGTLEPAETLGALGSGTPRVGVFAFPQPGKQGALEDLLLELGRVPYDALCDRAEAYAHGWHANVTADPHKDWGDLKGESGIKKATFAAATAVLKPGRGAVATIEDNRWVSEATRDHPSLAPCLAFLRELLAVNAPEAS
jgi:hypothetical protein